MDEILGIMNIAAKLFPREARKFVGIGKKQSDDHDQYRVWTQGDKLHWNEFSKKKIEMERS